VRILILASDKGSLINFRGDLIKELISCGVSVHVAAPSLDHTACENAELRAFGAVPAELRYLKRSALAIGVDVLAFAELCRLIWSCKPDMVFAYTAKPVIYGVLAAWLMRVPGRVALITGLGYAFIESSRADARRRLVRSAMRLLYRISLVRATLVIFQNPDDQLALRSLGVLRGEVRTHVVSGSGVNLLKYYPSEIPGGSLSFLMVARILRDKGVVEFIAAGRELLRKYPSVQVLLAGPFDENPEGLMPATLHELLAGSGVRYIGSVTDVRALLADCHVFVLPSYGEGMPRTVLEAMAVGRPIITTDVPGCRATVLEARNGFLVAARSVDELKNAMQRFIDDPSSVRRMGAESLRIAREKFDVKKVNKSIMSAMGI
jgi:glycosyltransferase involved in cell wall biosynthesis